MMCSTEIYDSIESGTSFFQHGHTYIGHPIACAAANAVITKLTTGGIGVGVEKMGAKLTNGLQSAFGQHPHVGNIRGRGLFIGLEIVADRATKKPFDPNLAINKALKRTTFEAGLACYPMGGTIDGKRGDHILLAPPFIMQEKHIDEIVDKLAIAFSAVL